MVEIENIHKSYNSVQALKGVSLSVGKGELFGLIGPDGAGKSTLMRILVTLLLPNKGKVSIENFDVVSNFRQIRKIVGYMPGRFSLYHDLSVKENLQFFATVFGTTIAENYHLIKDIYCQIEPFETRLAGKLSGGMKQKLALSCALIHAPKVLILDEPTTGVDAVSRKEFWEMLRNLKNGGITIIVSTPYMDEAVLCDRVALIQDGEILSVDTPMEITKSFGKKIFAIEGGTSAERYLIINNLRKYKEIDSVFSFGDSLHLTCANNFEISDIESIIINNLDKKFTIKEIDAGIEDVFMDLMKTQ